jgi:hypothetical protein
MVGISDTKEILARKEFDVRETMQKAPVREPALLI